ncbi:MAG: putative sulfate/molybdate transporter [Bacteroidetes bacterium]|nr:putative sulfate/molybdate transporter [Bacteroidota bacterium]
MDTATPAAPGRPQEAASDFIRALHKVVFGGNIYNRTEFAGAFGDLGTFIPFVVAYITINKMDPLGILLAFGLFKIYVGLLFKTPMPVQPMKAIGGAAIANPAGITHGMIWGSGIFTAVFWTLMGLTGAIEWLAKITSKPVIRGIMLGLGISFVVEGLGLMRSNIPLAVLGLVLTFVFLTSQRVPAMLLLLVVGIASSFVLDPTLFGQLGQISLRFRLPELALGQMSWNELLWGSIILGIPQAPLTLGNAILGVAAENNELFPDHEE